MPASSWEQVFVRGLNKSVCRIGFGCEALGGFNWGDVDIGEVQAAISNAVDGTLLGQTILFDTSDTYGPKLSEERLGEALLGQTERAVIATKFGVRLSDGRVWRDASVSYADKALDRSLKRLQRDQIDLYQLHWPDGKTPLTETLTALENFRAEGRIKAYGVCNVSLADLRVLVCDFPGLASFSQSHSLIKREDTKHINDLCAEGLTFLAYGCLGQGLLSGKYNKSSRFGINDRRSLEKYKNFHGVQFANNLTVVEELKTQAAVLGRPVATLALQFVLADLPDAIALAGIKSTAQWGQNLQALKTDLPHATYSILRECSNEALS